MRTRPTWGRRSKDKQPLRVPASVPFLAEVLREADPRYVPYAERALGGINTSEARTALWHAARPAATAAEKHGGG